MSNQPSNRSLGQQSNRSANQPPSNRNVVQQPEYSGINRDRFEDLYVRFEVLMETLPYEPRYEEMFQVFTLYLDETRKQRDSTYVYGKTEKKTYLREQLTRTMKNFEEGRYRSSQYKF